MAGRFSEFDIRSEFPAYYKSLSRRLYEVLDILGASTVVRDMRVKMVTTGELVSAICTNLILPRDISHRRTASDLNQKVSMYVFGSKIEGTTTPGLKPDLDMLTVHEDLLAVTNVSESQQYEKCLILIQDHHTPPGYAKLQIMDYGVPQTGSQKGWIIL